MKRKLLGVLSTVSIVFLLCTAASAAVDGIWFSEDGGQTLAGYVQTYTTHSILVILTPQGDDFHVFLDPDYRDGVDIEGLDNANKHLQLTFNGDSSAAGTLTLPGQSQRTLILSKSFSSPDSGHDGDGIYQSLAATMSSAYAPAADTVSAYVQFYTSKAMIAIFTKDLVTYYVFLDDDYTDGVQVSDYIHGTSNLSMTFNQDGTIGATIEYGQGGSEAWTLNKSFTAPDTSTGPSGDCDVGPQEAQDISNTIHDLFAVAGETPASSLLDALSTLMQSLLSETESQCPKVTLPELSFPLPDNMTITLDFGAGCTLGDLTVSGSAVINLTNLDIDLGGFTSIGIRKLCADHQ